MALGAAGVQLGTAYLLCPESNTTAVHRAALKGAAAHHTALTNLFSGRPARGSGDFSPLWAGQNVSGCREIPAGQLTRELTGVF
jgi:nitronate monooxygenase